MYRIAATVHKQRVQQQHYLGGLSAMQFSRAYPDLSDDKQKVPSNSSLKVHVALRELTCPGHCVPATSESVRR